ncbi:hypothetical protein OPIT5_29420 [Opitutaceae bacterium TAV5]|nr:hypothetical protein OPIT5_21700 [Opitutaceae bacterium TAV5]AHF94898.1 hypothetical protein OPIT5_29420 [Opitutaceae bacterium TAV5]
MTPTAAQIETLLSDGLSRREAALRLGCSAATVDRVLAGPAPDAGLSRIGRPPVADQLSPDVIAQVRAEALAMSTAGRSPSPALPFALMALHEPERLPAGLRERALRRKPLPRSILTRVCQGLTGDARAEMRGDKFAKLNTVASPRDNTYIDADGARQDIRGGDFYVADDMTSNIPFWREGDDPSDPCTARWGVAPSRAQVLAVADHGTLRFIGHTIWANPAQSYNTYSVLWLYRQVFRDAGKPRLGMKHEHGIWAGDGVVKPLRSLGLHVEFAQSAKGKRIEMMFDKLQTLMSRHFRYRGIDLGRLRGEFQESNKRWLDIRAGKVDPRAAGLPHISEVSAAIADAFADYNALPSNGEILRGLSPDEAWERDMGRAAPLARLSDREEWLLMPQCSEVSLRDGLAKCRFKTFGEAVWWYGNAELFSHLGPGYRVRLRFDVADPDRAAVYSLETAARKVKTRGWLLDHVPACADLGWTPGQLGAVIPPGEFLGHAELFQRAPSFVMSAWAEHRKGHDYRKLYRRCTRALFRGAAGGKVDERHDGAGNSTRIEGAHAAPSKRGTAPAEAAAIIAAAERVTPAPPAGAPVRVTQVARDTPAAPSPAGRVDDAEALTRRLYGAPEDIFASP